MISLSVINFGAVRLLTERAILAENPTPEPEAAPLDPEVQTVFDILNESDFGCQNANVRRLVEALLGRTIPPKPEPVPHRKRTFTVATMIVFEEVTLFVGSTDSDGDALVYLPNGQNRRNQRESTHYVTQASDWRYANPSEIDAYVEQMAANGTVVI